MTDIPAPPTPNPSRFGWLRRRFLKLPVWAWIVVVLVIGGAASAGSPSDETPNQTTTEESTPVKGTDAPTTDAPTTDAPTTTSTLPPKPLVYEGSGDSVIEFGFPDGSDVGILTISHVGRGNFAVWSMDSELEKVDLLVNEIGNYEGTVLEKKGASFLEISAGGAWRIETNTVLQAPTFDPSISGLGDSVVLFRGDTGIADITHVGDSNFAVWAYPLDDGRPDLLVNEIGDYSGSVRFPGPALVEVTADGDWNITLQ